MRLRVRFPSLRVYLHLISESLEMVQTEDLFNGIREALKACAKVDFDKLIASVE